jgi:DNA-binding LacI/PurR family transcriptional regulator/AraC-like DNA-binding protein
MEDTMTKRLLIGVICEEPDYERTGDVLEGVISQAFRSGCDVAVIAPLYHMQYEWNSFRSAQKDIYRLALSDKFDGFLYDRRFFHNDQTAQFVDKLLIRSRKPVMMIDGFEHHIFENTAADDRRPFEELVEHLICGHGFSRIYCLTGPENHSSAQQRLFGYMDAMNKYHIPFDDSFWRYGDFWEDSACELANDIITGKLSMPEAVVCGNDISAARLIKDLLAAGISVPGDVAVTGFDCSRSDFNADRSITSYKRDNFRLGADAFRRLYRTITGCVTSRVTSSPSGLRLGGSCGCLSFTSGGLSRQDKVNRSFTDNLLRRDILMEAADKDNLTDALEVITAYSFYIRNMSRFGVCLTEDYLSCMEGCPLPLSPPESNTPMRRCIIRHSSGKVDFSTETFPAGDILPELQVPHKHPGAYFITPLHSLNGFFGYSFISYGKHACSYRHDYVPFISNLNNLLEIFRSRADMQRKLHDYSCDSVTGLPGQRRLSESFTQGSGLVTISITESDNLAIRYEVDELDCIMRDFSEMLRSVLLPGEVCGIVRGSCFAIITQRKRGDDIYSALCTKAAQSGSPLHFSLGEYAPGSVPDTGFRQAFRYAALGTLHSWSGKQRQSESPLLSRLYSIHEQMKTSPEMDWSIDSIASQLHISKSHLQKTYRSCFGSSIASELIGFRLDMAKKLLSGTPLSVTEIAEKCGYSSYVYFAKQFRKNTGMTPSDYRKNNTGE